MTPMTTNTTTKTDTGSRLVAAIETFWSAVADRHPELPRRIVAITGSGAKPRGLTLGHWARDRWNDDDGAAPELFIGGECIAMGAGQVATTIIHEAAHALLVARGDTTAGTSRQGRYHTRKGFAKAAEELGLEAPTRPHPTIGFSECVLLNATAAEYERELDELDRALCAAIGSGVYEFAPAPKRKPRRAPLLLGCDCGRIERKVPAAVVDAGHLDGLACPECDALHVLDTGDAAD